MATTYRNELKWSHSRASMLETCRRRYWYNYYRKWGYDKESKEALILSRATLLPMNVGSIVHDTLSEVIQDTIKQTSEWDLDRAVKAALYRFRQDLDDSLNERWRKDSKAHPCNYLDLYLKDMTPEEFTEKAKRQEPRIRAALRAYFNGGYHDIVKTVNPDDTLAFDLAGFPTFSLDGVEVHAKPDFAFKREEDGACVLFDWKTGRPRHHDRLQGVFYAFFAQEKWGFNQGDIEVSLAYLQDQDSIETFRPSQLELDEARLRLHTSFGQMTELVEDIISNKPKDVSFFYPTDNPDHCGDCQFRSICTVKPTWAGTKDEPISSETLEAFNRDLSFPPVAQVDDDDTASNQEEEDEQDAFFRF